MKMQHNVRRIKLIVSYDGTEFAGWQRQKNALTVQGTVEEKLRVMTSENVTLHGAGRTDAGVHALAMPAHFDTQTQIPGPAFKKGLNSLLPKSVQVLSADEVLETFHARLSACAKMYRYVFTTAAICLPTRRCYCTHVPRLTSFDQMTECLSFLNGLHDFSSFEATGSRDIEREGGKGAVREIYSTALHCLEEDNAEWYIDICGDGFLRKMVRNIVGTLFEVGFNRMTTEDFVSVLKAKNRNMAGPTAPACGLFLKKVYYEKPAI